MGFKERLRKALIYNDFERVKNLIESDDFSSDLLNDCQDFQELGVTMPFYYISQLWYVILPGEWKLCQEAVDKQLANLEKIASYLKKKFQVDVKEPFDDNIYKLILKDDLCEDPKDHLWWIEEDRLKECRQIDIDLYCAGMNFDFPETERLLQLGADDSFCFTPSDPVTSLYEEMSDDFSERDRWQTNTLYPRPDYDSRECNMLMIRCMFSSAAKYRMIKLLNKYYKEPTK
jgi:hypothetical protein